MGCKAVRNAPSTRWIDPIGGTGAIIDIGGDTLIITRLTVSTRLGRATGLILHDVALIDGLIIITF